MAKEIGYNLAMLRKTKNCLIVALLLLVIFSVCFSEDQEEAADRQEKGPYVVKVNSYGVGQPKFENLYLYNMNGRAVSMNTFAGKVVVIEFWTTWHRFCLQEITALNQLYKRYQPRGLEVLAVVLEDRQKLKDYCAANPDKINYQLFYSYSFDELAKEYDVWGLPTIYILDRKLKIKKKFSGYVDKATLEKEIKKLL